jgi:hypothetical protein
MNDNRNNMKPSRGRKALEVATHNFALVRRRRLVATTLAVTGSALFVGALMFVLYRDAAMLASLIAAALGYGAVRLWLLMSRKQRALSRSVQDDHDQALQRVEREREEAIWLETNDAQTICAHLLTIETRLRKALGEVTESPNDDTPSGHYLAVHEGTLRQELDYVDRANRYLPRSVGLLTDAQCMQLALMPDVVAATYRGYVSNYYMPPFTDTVRLHRAKHIAQQELRRRGQRPPDENETKVTIP